MPASEKTGRNSDRKRKSKDGVVKVKKVSKMKGKAKTDEPIAEEEAR